MLLNISSYASADLLDLFDQASLLKHMKKYSIAREWASNCSHYPVVHITPGYLIYIYNIYLYVTRSEKRALMLHFIKIELIASMK